MLSYHCPGTQRNTCMILCTLINVHLFWYVSLNRAVREKELTEKKMSNAQRGPVPPPRGPSDRPDHIMEELKSRNYQLQEKVGCGLGILCNGLVTNSFFLKLNFIHVTLFWYVFWTVRVRVTEDWPDSKLTKIFCTQDGLQFVILISEYFFCADFRKNIEKITTWLVMKNLIYKPFFSIEIFTQRHNHE